VTSFDYLVLGILVLSVLLGLLRGLIKEILSLCAYVAAFVGAVWWGPRVSDWLHSLVDNPLLRTGISYLAVFLVILLLVGLLNMTLGALISKTGLTPADHGLGGLFGLLRGTLVVLGLVTLAGYTELPQEDWWQEARLSKAAVRGVQTVGGWLPPSMREWIPY